MRTLIYIPIVHTQADMGTLSESVRRTAIPKLGEEGWKRKAEMIDRMWIEIERLIDSLALSYEGVRLYQDGLPVCEREAEIVSELANAGSRNHRLVLRLMKGGAKITGTESAEILVQEYELIKQILASGNIPEATARLQALGDSLLKKRDQYIAHRINNTMHADETGILFLGMLHSLGGYLDRDIRVICPIDYAAGSWRVRR